LATGSCVVTAAIILNHSNEQILGLSLSPSNDFIVLMVQLLSIAASDYQNLNFCVNRIN